MACIAIPVASHAADSVPLIGDEAHVSSAFVACPKAEDTDRFTSLLFRDRDKQAAASYAATHGCRPTENGLAGKVEDHSIWYGESCIRPRGQPDCLWFPDFLVRKN